MDKRLDRIRQAVRTPRGRNLLLFLVFLVIASILWVVQSLNEDVQRDLRCNLRVVNVPDSLVRVTPIPEAINVSILAKGTDMLKYWSHSPEIVIDYNLYKNGNRVVLGSGAIKSYIRNLVSGCQVQSVSPDSLSIAYTSFPGQRVAVTLDAQISPGHQYVLRERVRTRPDSVMLYSLDGMKRVKSVQTAPIHIVDVTKDQTLRVPVVVPPNCRAIPDSVEVSILVDPLVSKSRLVNIMAVNAPDSVKLITIPPQVEVYYTMPMSVYKEYVNEPDFKVTVDYRATKGRGGQKIPVKMGNVGDNFSNVFLTVDSVDYIIEHR